MKANKKGIFLLRVIGSEAIAAGVPTLPTIAMMSSRSTRRLMFGAVRDGS